MDYTCSLSEVQEYHQAAQVPFSSSPELLIVSKVSCSKLLWLWYPSQAYLYSPEIDRMLHEKTGSYDLCSCWFQILEIATTNFLYPMPANASPWFQSSVFQDFQNCRNKIIPYSMGSSCPYFCIFYLGYKLGAWLLSCVFHLHQPQECVPDLRSQLAEESVLFSEFAALHVVLHLLWVWCHKMLTESVKPNAYLNMIFLQKSTNVVTSSSFNWSGVQRAKSLRFLWN